MYIWCKNSGASIRTNTRIEKNASTVLKLDSAKNMTVSGQVCLREFWDFEILDVEFSSLPKGVTAKFNFAENVIFNDGVPYPDILSIKPTVLVKRHATQVVWVTFKVDKSAKKGTYEIPINIKVLCKEEETIHNVTCSLEVYSTILPDVKDQAMGHEYFYNAYQYFPYKGKPVPDAVPDNFFKYERYSDKWWDFFAKTLDAAKEIRINTFYVMALQLLADGGSKKVAEDKWEFNFDLFDKIVEFALSKGDFKTISLDATLTCAQNTTIESIDENSEIVKIEYTEEAAEVWAKVFYTAIYNHIKEKGWLDIFYAHIQDEPHQKETWLWGRKLARKYMPNVRCGEPIDMIDVAKELAGECNLYIPRTDEYEKDPKFFKSRQKKGDEVWVYTCCFPEESWKLNKFIDQPLLYSRLLCWACFSQNVTGFLHWGFLTWFIFLYGINPEARFKGDGYIVYPDAENNAILLSARAVATRDGVQDYELLNLLSKKNKKKALQISRRIAKNFTVFTEDDEKVNNARKEILTLLEN